jgi:hypothetical protein
VGVGYHAACNYNQKKHIWEYFNGPGGIRTRGLFGAIEEQVGEKGKKTVYYVYYVPKSPYCASISVPKLFPQYDARKAIRCLVLRR